jgi:hypothetical protein
MEFLTLKACFGVKSKEFFMKDNMYTLTKRAGCLMVAALLTYLSLGSASWGAPNKTLQKLLGHHQHKKDIHQLYGRAFRASRAAHDIRSTPHAISESDMQRGRRKAAEAEEYLAQVEELRSKIQQDRAEAEQEIQRLNKESIQLIRQTKNQVPPSHTPERERFNALRKEATGLHTTLTGDKNPQADGGISDRFVHEMVEDNSEAYGLALPPKAASKLE